MPNDVLEGQSIEKREERWRRTISEPNAKGQTPVADRDGEIVDWASSGPGRDERFSDQGELGGLDSHPSALSTGVGHALISAVELALSEDGFASASLWVLDGNARSASFYERHGWSEDGNVKLDERPDMTLFERRRTKSLS